MKSWWKKALTFAVGVYAFSVTTAFAGYITDAATEVINTVTENMPSPGSDVKFQAEYKSELDWFTQNTNTLASKIEEKTDIDSKEQAKLAYNFKITALKALISHIGDNIPTINSALFSKEYALNEYRISNKSAVESQLELHQKLLDSINGNISDDQLAKDAQKSLTKLSESQNGNNSGCTFELGKSFSLGACIDSALGWFIQFTVTKLALGIFYFSSIFLHFTIAEGILSFKELIGTNNLSSTSSTVYTLWLLIRNLVWTGVLFSLFYLAILQLFGKTHEFGKAIAMIVVFALFSGFSFKASLFLIDISNIATVSIYKNIAPNWSTPSTNDPGIGTRYIKLLGVEKLSDAAKGTAQDNSILGTVGGQGKIVINLMTAIGLLFNAYVILMMAILFTIRNIALFAGIILSPLLLVDKVIPLLSDPAQKFRKLFFGQLIFAPIFMLCIYVGLKLSDVVRIGLQNSGGSSTFGVKIFNLVAISAIFYFTYDYCKKLSGAIGSAGLNALGGLARSAMIATPLGLAGRAGSVIGQNSIGALGRHLSREGGYLDRNRSSFMGLGEKAFNAARYTGNTATYDFNNSKLIANAGSKLGTFAGNKSAFSSEGNMLRVDKGDSFSDKEKAVRERLKYINNNYTDEVDKQKAIDRAIGDGGVMDHTRLGGMTLVGDTVLSKITNKARIANNDKSDLRSFAKSLSSNKLKSSVSDSFNEVDFENKDLDELSGEIAKLKKKADKGGPDAQKIFNTILQKKLSSYFTSKIQSDKVLKNEDGTAIKITETTSENFMKGVTLFMETNAAKIATIINQGSTLSESEQNALTAKFMENINETVTKTAQNIWTTENEQKNKISKIEEERRARTATSGPINLEKRRIRKAARTAATNDEQRNNNTNTQEQTEPLRQAA